MDFNKHSNLEGQHAFLSASQYHWVNYDLDKLQEVYIRSRATEYGTQLHDLAQRCINLCIKLPQNRKTLNMYVNDAIRFRMNTEQVLYYSDNCFGTADAISFNQGKLRIHDLKTGVTPASFLQLDIYEALFCLEYDCKPSDIDAELRIYQSDEIIVEHPEDDRINYIINKIIQFDKKIEELKLEV